MEQAVTTEDGKNSGKYCRNGGPILLTGFIVAGAAILSILRRKKQNKTSNDPSPTRPTYETPKPDQGKQQRQLSSNISLYFLYYHLFSLIYT